MDRRTQKTKTAIYNALKNLLAKKSYTKITVQEIIDAANIGRSTFYAHYETKDDLLKELCQDIFLHIMETSLSGERTHDFSSSNNNLKTLLTHILYHIKDETTNLKGLLDNENGEYFWQIFRIQATQFIKDHILNDITKSPSVPENILVNHYSNSFEGLVKWWIRNGMKQAPEEIETYYEKLLSL